MHFLGILLSLYSFVIFARVEVIDIPDVGQIRYEYQEEKLVKVSRLARSGEVLYSHSYQYDDVDHHF